jgi:Flp pilus assembly protein TadG
MRRQLKGRFTGRVLICWAARFAASTCSEAGTSLLEVALLIPMLSLLFLAVIDVGRLAYMSIEVSNAARAASAYGAQSHITAVDSTGMVQAAKNDAPDITGLAATAIHFTVCSGSATAGGGIGPVVPPLLSSCPGARLLLYVQVSTSATYTPWFPYTGSPGSWQLSGLSTMRAED